MKQGQKRVLWFIMIVVGIATIPLVQAWWGGAKTASYYSPCAVVAGRDGREVYVAEYSADQVVGVDLASGTIQRVIPLGLPPSGLALDAGAGVLYATLESADGQVAIIDVASGTVIDRIPVGHTPLAPAVSPDGRLLAVCNRFNNNVSLIDVASRKELGRVAVPREPVAAAFTPDGRRLVVANHLPAMPANSNFLSSAVTLMDPVTRSVITNLMLPNGSTGLRGLCVSPDGRYAYVTHSLGRYQLPTTQLERGWMNTSALSIVDLQSERMLVTVLLDDVDQGAANPWGVACTADGTTLCIAQAGTHEISVIDRVALHGQLEKVAKGEKVGVSLSLADIPYDLSLLIGIRQRVKLPGNGPRALCLAGDAAVAGLYFGDELAVVPLKTGNRVARTVSLGPKAPLSKERKGEMFFNDAQFCFQEWQSCASCHPDGRADGLNWDLLNDGIGNPKNTKSMLLCFQTPPSMSQGIRESAAMGVRAGLKFIQFAVRPEEDARAIDKYLTRMKPVPSPYLVNGKLSAAAQRGRAVFKKAGCAACHPAPFYTDLQGYNLGMGEGIDQGKSFDTPTLAECWRTAPYFHDGRAYTMQEVLLKYNHRNTATLPPQELDDLADYVLSL
jgi:YVTN family beta-propeller protein